MSAPEFSVTFIGRKLLFRLFLSLAAIPLVVLLLFFLPMVAAAIVLVVWLAYMVLFYRSAWRYCRRVLALVSNADV